MTSTYILQCVAGSAAVQFELKSTATVNIGRAKTSDFRLNEPSVSSKHAVIDRGFVLKDLGSTNGTLYNNQPLSKGAQKKIKIGDKIKFGEVEVHVKSNRSGGGTGEGPTKKIPSGPSSGKFHKLFPTNLYYNSGSPFNVSGLYGQIVCVYFGAKWSPLCARITEQLVKVYYDLQKAPDKPFQVVFVSKDQSKSGFNDNFRTMPWLSISYTDRKARNHIETALLGPNAAIPFLVLLNEKGEVITKSKNIVMITKNQYPFKKGSSPKKARPGGRAPRGRGGLGVKKKPQAQDLNQSKRFGGNLLNMEDEAKEDDGKTVQELMDEEFTKIIGHDTIKKQLQQFHKKVQLDKIRQEHQQNVDTKRLYHMLFMGPPGTGKTTMANLVARIMVKMGIIETEQVVFVNNALDLLAGFVGQTAPKVDAKVAEAKGGVLFIDEAYSIVKSEKHQKDSFGKEAIETIMKHLDPPSCVFIFAGYEKEMEGFLQVNSGLARRIPYRYTFSAYADDELMEIFVVVCKGKGEDLAPGTAERAKELLGTVPAEQKLLHNAGMINNWVAFAQMERDDRIDIDDALENPDIASILSPVDFEACMDKLKDCK